MLSAVLFWGHIVFIFGAMSIGFFLPPMVVFALVAAHRLHVMMFDGCILTTVKQKLQMMPSRTNFLEFACAKVFGKALSRREVTYLDYFFAIFPVLVVLTRYRLS